MTLEELEQLCAAATPGPWAVGKRVNDYINTPSTEQLIYRINATDADMEFIAAARTYMPLLLDVVQAAERINKQYLEWKQSMRNPDGSVAATYIPDALRENLSRKFERLYHVQNTPDI